MNGAIDFMRAWRDICNEQDTCSICSIQRSCEREGKTGAWGFTDEGINNLITAVMAAKVEEKARKRNEQTM